MQRRHTACQWNGQAACLIHNKCRGRIAQRPYVRLPPLAYVTCSRPRGSIGSPPGQGAKAYTIRSRHVSAPDPRLVLIKVQVFSVPESRDPAVSGLDPTQRGPDPILGVRFAPVEVLDLIRGPGLYIHGSGTSAWGSGPAGDAQSVQLSGHAAVPDLPRWCGRCYCWPRVVARRLGESWPGPTYSLFTMRLKVAVWVLCFYTAVGGTPVLGYRQLWSTHIS
jgi:hypothetical protein